MTQITLDPREGGGASPLAGATDAYPKARPYYERIEPVAESFGDLDEDVRQSITRIQNSPFVTKTTSLRGFVFDVATGLLREVS